MAGRRCQSPDRCGPGATLTACVGLADRCAGAAEYAFNELGWKTAYAVTDTSIDYSLSLSRYFNEHFEALGGEEHRHEPLAGLDDAAAPDVVGEEEGLGR